MTADAAVTTTSDKSLTDTELQEKVIATLCTIYDPEIPINIYDLGLIYDVGISPEKDVLIQMTLTAPGCPVAQTFPQMIESTVAQIPEVNSATVSLVWDPPWTQERMSEAAKVQLGLV